MSHDRRACVQNHQVNEIYERYVPNSWTKPTPDADQQQREQWIIAKYKHRYELYCMEMGGRGRGGGGVVFR